MASTLQKEKTLLVYVPGSAADPGFPGSPATPERVTWETRQVHHEVPASFMQRIAGTWITPLDELRNMLLSPGISAAQAHYSDVWAQNAELGRFPVSCTGAWIVRSELVKVVVPAQPARPPRPPTPGSPDRSSYDFHLGWNAGAQSMRVLPSGWKGVTTFTITKPVGVVVGFAPAASVPTGTRTSFANIAFGVVVGSGVIRIREGGATGRILANATGNDEIEAKVKGRVIEWSINGVMLHRGPFSLMSPFVLDAALYAGGDSVVNASLKDGIEAEVAGAALMLPAMAASGVASELLDFKLSLGAVNLQASELPQAQCILVAPPLRAQTGGQGGAVLDLRRLAVSAAQEGRNANGNLRAAPLGASIVVEGGDGAWVPEYSIASLGMLPLVCAGSVLGGQSLEFMPAMRPLWARGSESAYGEGRSALHAMQVTADAEAITPLIRAQELLGAVPQMEMTTYLSLVMSERIGSAGVASIAAYVVQMDAREQLSAEDEAELAAHIVAAAMEQIGVAQKASALVFKIIGGRPVLLEGGEAWALNTESNATTRYENYSFNSFMRVGGLHFGVRKDGVHLLDGQNDAGLPIEAGVSLGRHDFGSQELKHIEAVYAGVSASGALMLRIGDGRNQYTYQARRVDAEMRTQRFDPGRGLRANYFTFDLLNAAGGEFELDNITFSLVASKRRI